MEIPETKVPHPPFLPTGSYGKKNAEQAAAHLAIQALGLEDDVPFGATVAAR
jgi:hypothetical protein